MKKILIIFLLILSFFAAQAAYAQDQKMPDILTIDLAENHIDINTGFHGTFLQIFGVTEQGGDVAIIVEGPMRTMNVRQKQNIFGAWINKSSETFEKVPSFYAYAISRPLQDIAAPDILDKYQVGTDYVNVQAKTKKLEPEKLKLFREALIRNKQQAGLFADHSENIIFLKPGFFRTQIYMPANVPVGEYTVRSLYFKNGELQDMKTNTLKVAQVGLSAQVHKFAQRKRFLYALLGIAIALFSGWFSNKFGLKR